MIAFNVVKKLIRIFLGKEKNPIPELLENFRLKSKNEKMKAILKMTLFVSILLLTGGGLDMDGGFLDLDLKFGIGYHRNLFSHTILVGITSEFIFRFLLYTMEEFRLTDKNNKKIL